MKITNTTQTIVKKFIKFDFDFEKDVNFVKAVCEKLLDTYMDLHEDELRKKFKKKALEEIPPSERTIENSCYKLFDFASGIFSSYVGGFQSLKPITCKWIDDDGEHTINLFELEDSYDEDDECGGVYGLLHKLEDKVYLVYNGDKYYDNHIKPIVEKLVLKRLIKM